MRAFLVFRFRRKGSDGHIRFWNAAIRGSFPECLLCVPDRRAYLCFFIFYSFFSVKTAREYGGCFFVDVGVEGEGEEERVEVEVKVEVEDVVEGQHHYTL